VSGLDWTPADARLAKIHERLQRERAAGQPARSTPPDVPAPAVRRTPTPDDQLTRERRQAMWDSICEHAPELAQLLRDLKALGIKAEVETYRAPGLSHGPDPRPFNAIRIEARLPSPDEIRGRRKSNGTGALPPPRGRA
jgi:hypothetical protein